MNFSYSSITVFSLFSPVTHLDRDKKPGPGFRSQLKGLDSDDYRGDMELFSFTHSLLHPRQSIVQFYSGLLSGYTSDYTSLKEYPFTDVFFSTRNRTPFGGDDPFTQNLTPGRPSRVSRNRLSRR